MAKFEDLPPEILKRIVAFADKTSVRGLLLANKTLSSLALGRDWHLKTIKSVFSCLLQNDPLSIVDRAIDRCVNSIMSKPLWQSKCRDEGVVGRWMAESGMTGKQMKYAIDKCFYYRQTIADASILPSPIGGVWYKDNIHIDLGMMTPAFEDWQPETNETVLNVVHPSLYPVVHGVTRDRCGGVLTSDESKFQWLPAEFEVRHGRTRIASYINNVPDTEQYGLIARAFDEFVPLFSCVLTDYTYPLDVAINYERYIDEEGDYPWFKMCREGTDPDTSEAGEEDFIVLEPDEFEPPPRRGRVNLSNSDLQVIVKIAHVVLTPEKPKFALGKWHVEGTRAEDIVASGIYYFDSSNVTDSALALRRAFGIDFDEGSLMAAVPQSSHTEVSYIYGIETTNGENHQDLGQVATVMGRCLAFPNYLQHRVVDFELKDRTKCGHRKILAFFLVNPDARVPSSATVPAQQEHMPREEALEYRQQLMEERSSKADAVSGDFFQLDFSLCEH